MCLCRGLSSNGTGFRAKRRPLAGAGPAGVFEQDVAVTVTEMRKEEDRVVRWAVVRGFHERTAAPSSKPRRQSRVQVVSLRAA